MSAKYCLFSVHFLILLTAGVSVEGSTCSVGSQYNPVRSPVYSAYGWYLNLQLPLSCSGNVTEFTIHFYDPLFPGTYCLWWTFWESTNNINYYKANTRLHKYCHNFPSVNNDGEESPQRNRYKLQLPSTERYLVKQGSIIGGFMKISLIEPPLHAVGESTDDPHPNRGVCRTLFGVNENSLNVTCTSNNFVENNVLHIEADIDVIDCGNLLAPSNGGIIQQHGTQYSAIVHYYCNSGYMLVNGSRERICLINGSWNGSEPTCVKEKCASINIDHGTVRGYISRGSVVYFSCDVNYSLVGPTNISCQSNGEWSDVPPNCIPNSCTDLDDIINGSYTKSSDNTTLRYYCNDGYILNGDAIITCVNGNWSGVAPVCNILHCNDPVTPSNGNRYGIDTSFGSLVSFTCNEGYIISGSQNITCTSSGLWSDEVPTCQVGINNENNAVSTKTNYTSITTIPTNGTISTTVTIPTNIGTSDITVTIPTNIGTISTSDITATTAIPTSGTISTSDITATTAIPTNGTISTSDITATTAIPTSGTISTSDITVTITVPTNIGTIFASTNKTTAGVVSTMPMLTSDSSSLIYIIAIPIVLAVALIVTLGIIVLIWRLVLKRRKKFTAIENPTAYIVPNNDVKANNEDSIRYYASIKISDTHEYDEPIEPYELPARVQKDLYIQLNRIRVKILQAKDIQLKEYLGSGQFGSVHKALWHNIPVAVKTLLNEANEADKVKFLQEAAIMGQFSHVNIVKLYGVITEGDHTMLVVELMNCDLYHYLLSMRFNASSDVTLQFTFLNFCRQICNGMMYLAKRGYVHRDLAARNILLTESKQCKIADFGMSRDIEDGGYYVARRGGMVPIKWTAPEALKYRRYSSASDVWSYACVLYEIWSLGHKPFEQITHVNVLNKTDKGYRLSPPPGCPYHFYELMIKCWHPHHKQRPSFNEIMLLLQEHDQRLLEIPDKDKSTHPQAGILGANLEAGQRMYTDLQNTYMYYFTLENV